VKAAEREFVAPARSLRNDSGKTAFLGSGRGIKHSECIHALEIRPPRRETHLLGVFEHRDGLGAQLRVLAKAQG
jgi:hypothetical protein